MHAFKKYFCHIIALCIFLHNKINYKHLLRALAKDYAFYNAFTLLKDDVLKK